MITIIIIVIIIAISVVVVVLSPPYYAHLHKLYVIGVKGTIRIPDIFMNCFHEMIVPAACTLSTSPDTDTNTGYQRT